MSAERRAQQAQQILTNPLFKEAFAILEAHYKDKMLQTKPADIEAREHLYRSCLVLSDVKSALTAYIEQGKIEKSNAAKREKARL